MKKTVVLAVMLLSLVGGCSLAYADSQQDKPMQQQDQPQGSQGNSDQGKADQSNVEDENTQTDSAVKNKKTSIGFG